jgi:hypothetical protein
MHAAKPSPLALAPDSIMSLDPWHAACVNLSCGAYGRPERAWTRNGMRINLQYSIGNQAAGMETDQDFEAGWTPKGAVCLAHSRVPKNGPLEVIASATPRLAGRTGPEFCTEERAAELGALRFNCSNRAR